METSGPLETEVRFRFTKDYIFFFTVNRIEYVPGWKLHEATMVFITYLVEQIGKQSLLPNTYDNISLNIYI